MTKSTLMSFLTGMVFFVMTWTTAMAHVSHIEPQAARNQTTCQPGVSPEFCNPDTPAGSPEEDFSFEHPFEFEETFDLDEEGEPPSGPNIEISKAIHAFLSAQDPPFVEGDVDWFEFVLTESDLMFDSRRSRGVLFNANTAVVSASALPWRCADYTNSLPTVALIGEGIVTRGNTKNLPTEVQDALTSLNSEAGPGEKWGIFVDEDGTEDPTPRSSSHFPGSDEEPAVNVDWWGGNPTVLFADADFSGQSPDRLALTEPGTYYLVVWDPNGNALDYTLSTGMWEQPTFNQDIVADATRLFFDNDNLLDIQCNDPCDGVADEGRSIEDELKDIGDAEGDPEEDICGPIRDV